jgi:universal stress protein A
MMALRGPVLAAIDLTDADEVLAQGSAMATSLQTRLIVCHVLPEVSPARVLFPQLSQLDTSMEAALEQRAREAVEARVAAVTERSTTDFEVTVDFGSAHAGILSRAEQMGAGLVVVGSGGVADRVARYAPCAVLVARPSKRGSVLAATDFSDPSLPAIAAALAEAVRRGVRLRLMHCLEAAEPILLGSPSFAIGILPALPENLIEELENDARERLRTSLARSGVSGDCIVSRGLAAPAIVQAARDVPTELVVVGIRGRTNLSRLLLGSVAETVLKTAPCSVLVVHLAP